MHRFLLFHIGVALLVSTTAFAHHPFDDEFDKNKSVMLTGTVTKVEWMNPHVNVHLDVRDQSNAGQWVVEMGAPAALGKEGWTRDLLKAGDQLVIDGWRAKDGTKRAAARSIQLPSGRTLSAASSFYESQAALAADARDAQTAGTSGTLPRTASPLPLTALLGLLALVGGLALRAARF